MALQGAVPPLLSALGQAVSIPSQGPPDPLAVILQGPSPTQRCHWEPQADQSS